jgi:hypothetical protein
MRTTRRLRARLDRWLSRSSTPSRRSGPCRRPPGQATYPALRGNLLWSVRPRLATFPGLTEWTFTRPHVAPDAWRDFDFGMLYQLVPSVDNPQLVTSIRLALEADPSVVRHPERAGTYIIYPDPSWAAELLEFFRSGVSTALDWGVWVELEDATVWISLHTGVFIIQQAGRILLPLLRWTEFRIVLVEEGRDVTDLYRGELESLFCLPAEKSN